MTHKITYATFEERIFLHDIISKEKGKMIELKATNVTIEQYLNTNIESLCLRFVFSYEPAYMDEFDVPKGYKYNVFVYTREDEEFPDFIEISNYKWLQNVIEDPDCLPDIRFNFEDEEGITLIQFIKKHIFEADIPQRG